MNTNQKILPIIVLAQFCCTSLWFAGNAVMGELLADFQLETSALGHLTSAVQLGFISGTLVFASLNIADRFSPSKVFFVAAIIGGIFNLGTLWSGNTLVTLIIFRLLTGFSLAGIYPVGMKIAADYFDKGLGKSLGFLVGALVLGTAFPHFLKAFTAGLPWRFVIQFTSALALGGGLLIASMIPDGPHRKAASKLDLSAIFKVFQKTSFRAAAWGYFGHMWELYAFWTFVPIILTTYHSLHPKTFFDTSLWSFSIIGIGSLGCILGGILSQRFGSKQIASKALSLSCICCLLSPLLFIQGSKILFLIFLLIWGLAVVADSPLFSTLVAHNAPAENKGTALTIVNCVGFAITIFSIQLLNFLRQEFDLRYIYLWLAIGPVLGLIGLLRK